MRERLPTITTALSAVLSLVAALSMRDHVRLVEIVMLFFGGVGTGAGLAGLVAARRAARSGAPADGASAGGSAQPRSPSTKEPV